MKTKKQSPQNIVIFTRAEKQVVIRALEASRGAKALTIDDGIEQWCAWLRKHQEPTTAYNDEIHIRAWARDMEVGGKPVRDVDEDAISDWINGKSDNKLGTRRMRLSIVRLFFKFMSIKGYIEGDPSRLVTVNFRDMTHAQKEPKEPKVFTAAEFDTLIHHLDERIKYMRARSSMSSTRVNLRVAEKKLEVFQFWRVAAIISRCAGLRLGDVCQLEWETLAGNKFTVWTDKRDKRVQPYIWNPKLFTEATGSIIPEDNTHCFPKQREIILNPKERHSMSMQFQRILQQAKLAGQTFHSLRHTYITECHRAGIPIPHIAASVGHSNIATTRGYIH